MMQIIRSALHLATLFHLLIGSPAVCTMHYGERGCSGKAKGWVHGAFERLYNFLPHNHIVCMCTVMSRSVGASVMAMFVLVPADNGSGLENTSFKAP